MPDQEFEQPTWEMPAEERRRILGFPVGTKRPPRRAINIVLEALEGVEEGLKVRQIHLHRYGATIKMSGKAGEVEVEISGSRRGP